MHKPLTRRLLPIVCTLLLLGLACNLPLTPTPPVQQLPTAIPVQELPTSIQKTNIPTAPPAQATTTNTPPIAQATTANTPPPDIHGRAFASYPVIAVKIPPSYNGGYTLPLDLTKVQGMAGYSFSEQQRKILNQNGFVAVESPTGKYNEFYQVYESVRYEYDQPVFATTDAVFHVYHLIFDKMLRDLERENFDPMLQSMTLVLLNASEQQLQALQGTSLEEPARRNTAFFAVAAQLLKLDQPVAPGVKELADAELALINQHSGVEVSPIWDRNDLPDDQKLREDYSQYIPRGHYTRSEQLKQYFTAMMWYGRMTFRLRDNFETQRALLLTQALRTATTADGQSASQLWENIYDPTVFIVGKADDLSYHEYGALSDSVFGSNPDLKAFADNEKLAAFINAARQLPPPQINSMWVWIWEDKKEATQGFRVMGQRFTLDQYVFGQLIWRNVGTLENPRWLPKGLDFFAAMGSKEALDILNQMGESQYLHYPEQMTKVQEQVAALREDSWTQNLYWSWLYAFQPVIQPKDSRFPAFMQNQAWTRKELNTALGSWTELKHDTILYAKQVMAEMGGGGSIEPPHGWVEPNPEAFARMLALAQMTEDGLNSRGLLSEKTRGNLDNLIDMLKFDKDMAERELAGKTLSNEDYWRIQYFGGELEAMTLNASDCEDASGPACRNLQDLKSALIADVASGNNQALEEATGQPAVIYVVLPDQPWRIGIGAIFSYYEFPVSFGERMTDEAWQAKLADGQAPPLPDWTNQFFTP